MAAQVLFHHVFLKFGFPAVLQSDRGREFLNAVLHRITELLSIKHIFTSSYRPRLNRATERIHRWLNAAIGIFCEQHQSNWESYLQLATYSHNTTSIQGTKDLDPFFLNFGRHALPPEVISLQLLPHPTFSACKHIYQAYPPAREIPSRYGKLRRLISQSPHLLMQSAAHGGTYTINLDKEPFDKLESQ